MNRATPATGWVRNPVMKSPDLDPVQASSYDYGWTWNPITGCLNHVNGLCRGGNFPCYAYGLANGRLKDRYRANENIAHLPILFPYFAQADPFYPRFWDHRLKTGIFDYGRKPKGVFVCDMGDLFGIGVPEEWTEKVLAVAKMECHKNRRYYLLTKQPQNLIKFSPFPDNCWVGVTVCNDKMLDVAVDKLEDIQAQTKYISFEPLLEHLTLSLDYALYYSGINWVIIGAQTKPVVYPKVEWVEEIVEACDKARVPVFLKDNLGRFLPRRLAEQPGNLYPKDGWYPLRQEMPGWLIQARISRKTHSLLELEGDKET